MMGKKHPQKLWNGIATPPPRPPRYPVWEMFIASRLFANGGLQMNNPCTLVCFCSLWLGKELSRLHLKVGDYWNHHRSVVLFANTSLLSCIGYLRPQEHLRWL